VVTAVSPSFGVLYRPCSDHIQVDIEETALQMRSCLNSSRVVTIFPKRAFAVLSCVIFLACSAGDQLDHGGDIVSPATIPDNEVDMLCES
jgi:hypothetical protein